MYVDIEKTGTLTLPTLYAWCQFCFIDVDPLKFLVCKPKKKKRGLMKQKKVLGGRWEEKSRIREKF